MPSGPAIPVEAILKLALDKGGAKAIEDFMAGHEKSWSRIEQAVSKIGQHADNLGRFGLAAVGAGGVGAVVKNFFQTSQSGSNLALASGVVTGGVGAWHPYAQSLLGAQHQTGVGAQSIEQGLVQALQAAGGTPTPAQAAVLGGLLAGYGQTVGLTPSQVANVVGPLLQASNKPLTSGAALGIFGTLTGGLSNVPGSQQAPLLGLLSQLGVSQAVGSGPAGGYTSGLKGLTAAVNTAAGANSIWRNPSLTGGAINSISGGLQNAYGNPSQEAFFQLAGISYDDQRKGFTPENMQRIMAAATSLYGTGSTRDIFLRTMFGLQGADLLEQFAPGTSASKKLQHALSSGGNGQAQVQHQIHHAQQRTTPGASANRAGGGFLGWLEANPLHALLGLGGAAVVPTIAKGALKLLGKGAASGAGALFGEGGAEGILGGLGIDLGGAAFGAGTLGIGAILSGLILPDNLSTPGSNGQGAVSAVQTALKQAEKKFGNVNTPQAKKWLWNQFGFRFSQYQDGIGVGGHQQGTPDRTGLWDTATAHGEYPKGATTAQQLLTQIFSQLGSGGGQQDPITTLNQASQALLKAAQALQGSGRKDSSYQIPGGGAGLVGTAGVQALSAAAPGVEFAALTGASGSFSGNPQVASGAASASSGAGTYVSAGGGGGQPCICTFYNPADGGINGGPNYADGGLYHTTDMACAADPKYAFGTQIQITVGGKTINVTVRDRGPAVTGSHFDLTQGAFEMLGSTSAGVLHGTFKVVGSSPSSSSSSSGGSSGGGSSGSMASARAIGSGGRARFAAVPAMAGSPGAGQQGTQVHVHIDGRKVSHRRVIVGHKH